MITPINSVSDLHIATNAIVMQKALEVQKETTVNLLDNTIEKLERPESKPFKLLDTLT